MAGVKISDLPAAVTLDGTEVLPVVQGGVTRRSTSLAVGVKKAVVGGNLGAAFTLATAGAPNTILEGTLDQATTTLTITGLIAGANVRLVLSGTVDRTLTVVVGASSQSFTVSPRSGAPVTVEVDTPDATTIYVTLPGAQGPAGPPGPIGSSDPYDPLKFGMAVSDLPPSLAPGTFSFGTANRAYFKRLINGKQGATGVRFRVGAAAGNVSVGVYRKSGVGAAAVPGTLLASSGSVACPASGIAVVSLGATVDVETGDFVAFSCSSGTATFGGLFNGFATDTLYSGLGGYKESFHPVTGDSPVLTGPGVVGGIILQVV